MLQLEAQVLAGSPGSLLLNLNMRSRMGKGLDLCPTAGKELEKYYRNENIVKYYKGFLFDPSCIL